MSLLNFIVNDVLIIVITWFVFSRFGNLVVKLKHRDSHSNENHKRSNHESSRSAPEHCPKQELSRNVENRIRTVENDLEELKKTMNQIQTKVQAQVPTSTPAQTQTSQPHVNAETRIIKYASAFSSSPNCFFRNLLDVNNRSVKFILTLGESDGTYVVNDFPDAQQSVITSFNAISQMVVVREQVTVPSRVVNVNPGKLEKNGDSWIVVRKVEVKLI